MEPVQAKAFTDSEKEIMERKVADAILERGVRIPIPAPRFLRLLGKKEINITIEQRYLRTLHTASSLALKEGFSYDDLTSGDMDVANQVIEKHAPTVSKWMAINILNNRWLNRLFSAWLGSWLMDHLIPKRILEIVSLMVLFGGYQDFTSTIRLIRSQRMTTPRNQSPQIQGSQEATL